MVVHSLETFFNPSSIAVIGASEKLNSVGMKIFKNLIDGGYSGAIYPVNPKHKTVLDKTAFPSVEDITSPVDLAVIVTPAATTPDILNQCANKGIHHVIIISAGFNETGDEGAQLERKIKEIASKHNIHILGPNCLGMMLPHLKLNLTFSNSIAIPGNIGVISQSGAILSSILDWAVARNIRFSSLFSLGNAIDLDFGNILDYLALDPHTQSILLYIESVHNARRFMSALRVAASKKPVVVVKAGREGEGSRAAISHTGALIGYDDVFDSALKRAGVVRVTTIEQLFTAAEILSKNFQVKGNRLAIVTNGGGAGVMAADQSSRSEITVAKLSKSTITSLDKVLPKFWSHQNPVDILGDASPERYSDAITTCLSDPNVDGLLAILTPVAMSQPDEVAKEIISIAQKNEKPILTCWFGEQQVKSARNLFSANNIPSFSTPESAIEAFSYLASYHHNQQLLMQIPAPIPFQSKGDSVGSKMIIESALAENRKILTSIESKAILSAFKIPTTLTIEARTAPDALIAAESLGFPVVMKINSPDITHKQDVGGVQVNITNAQAVRELFKKMIERAKKLQPSAQILGVTIEHMRKELNDRELMIGIFRDPTFGPVISFGAGGTIVEVIKDRAIALPPLNRFIAESLISQTKISKLLGKFRNMPKVQMEAVISILLKVSEIVCELPQIREMDINPLIVNEHSAIAVDARIVVDFNSPALTPYDHMAIHPYPSYLVKQWQLADGTNICIRPIRPEDAEINQEFVRQLSSESKYFRFMGSVKELSLSTLLHFTQLDYDREMALIASILQDGQEKCIGVTRYIVDPNKEMAEFSIAVADDWQGKGIGSTLLINLLNVAKIKGVKILQGVILANNENMKKLAMNLGFSIKPDTDKNLIIAEKKMYE